jgi:hypothetical protein
VAADSLDRDPPPARAATVIASRVDPEHPKRPLPPITLTAKPVGDAIQTLLGFESPGAPVVSVYWSVSEDPGRLKGAKSGLHDLVRAVRDRADSHDVPHADRASLRADAGRILELEELVPALQGRTVALFRCSQRDFEEAVVLPGWVRDRIALDATPYLRPLLAVRGPGRTAGRSASPTSPRATRSTASATRPRSWPSATTERWPPLWTTS